MIINDKKWSIISIIIQNDELTKLALDSKDKVQYTVDLKKLFDQKS